MSKLDMLAGGIRKCEMVVFITAPCSTKREAICVKTIEYIVVQSQIGSSLRMHLTSSTWVMLKWVVCGLNYQAQFIIINQIQAVLGNRVQLGL